MSATQYSDQQVEQSLKNAVAAGDHSAATLISAEIQRRKGGIDYSSLGPATNVPGPQGFMEDSGINAMGRGIRENIGGGAGAALGASGGMELGGTVGTFLGGPGMGTAVGSGIGGIGGGILGALFGGQAQQAVFPTSEDTKRILQSDETNHPNMAWAGQQIPFLATVKPSLPGIKSAFTRATPEMTAAETSAIMGNRVGMAVGGGLGAASEVAMPLINGQDIDPAKVLASAILGTLFNEPNRLGRGLGMPATPSLADVRAQQMAAASAPPPMSTELALRPEAPLIDTHVVKPGEIGLPEMGAYPTDSVDVRFRQPSMLNGPDQMQALPLRAESRPIEQPMLPENASAGADSVMPRMRDEQAAGIQAQLDRLKERRAGLVSRGADKLALKSLDTQIKARNNALRGLQNDTTIIAPEPAKAPAIPITEITPTPTPRPLDVTGQTVTRVPDPRMAARNAGVDVIGHGERPAFVSADAITQAKLGQDAVAQSPRGASSLRDQLSAQERPSIQDPPSPVANKGAIPTPDESQRWDALVAHQEPIVKALRGDDLDNLGAAAGVKRQGVGDEAYREKIIRNTHPDDLQDAINATSNPTHNEKSPSISGKPSPADSVTPVSGVSRVVDTPEVASLRKQLAKADEEIFNAREDGDEYGAKGLEIARRKLQSKLDEAMNKVEPNASNVESMRSDEFKKWLASTNPHDMVRPWTNKEINRTAALGKGWSLVKLKVENSMDNAATGGSMAKPGTPIVAAFKGDNFEILDGQHRYTEANDRGDSSISAYVPEHQVDELLNGGYLSHDDSPPSTPPKVQSLGDKIRAKKAKLKGDTFNLPIAGISGDDARRLWNGALEVAAKLADAGTHIKQAAKQAAAWARTNFPKARFKDEEFHSAIEADVVEGLGAARKAGVKEESFKAAEQMDNNPDKFFTDAGETPVSTYMDGVTQTMKDAKHDMLSGRTVKRVWQHLKDFNRNFLRGNQAALDDLAKGGGGTGRKSPALDKLNERINGTRPGAAGVSKRGLYDEVITNARARSNELNAAYNGIRSTVDTLKGHEKEAFLANLVKWMQMDNSPTHLRNQPAVLKAVDTIRKVSRDIIEDLKKVGIDIGDSGIKYFNRSLDADVVKRNYDEFVTGMAKIYDQQWKQTDPKYVSDMVKATEAAKAYADATILGHDDIHLDGSDLLLSGKQRTSDPDFFKARTFTGAAGDELDRTMAKFYKRNPFETINTQINRAERRIGLAKAFGKTTWDADAGKYVLDPTARWKEFTDAAIKEGNEKIVPEVRERYQTMFGIGGNFNPSTMAFNQFTREMGYYAYLPFSGINSLVEPTVMAMRLNKPVSGLFQAYGKTFRSIARQLKDMPLDYKEKLADALGLAENATMRAARSLGRMDEQGMMTSKNLASYMFLTGNSVISNATSNAAVDIGMSALRVALLDHQHGQGGNTPRIWLEELGIKKADFDAVSKWLEGHVTDEDRFGAVLDGSREANIVRDALSKFVREGRSLPDAGTKSKTFSSPAGSMLLSLQSFLYDFADKVLGRNARQFMQGVKGEVHFDGDIDPTKLSAQDRMHLMAPMAMGMPALLAANYGIALIRETMYPDPEKIRRDRERTNGEINWNRFQRALSRTNALGPYDMLFNMFTQARYERDVAAMAVGPYMGGVLELAKNVAALSGERNSGNTNTAERKAVRSAWNIGPKPLLNMALSSLPATRALTPIAAAGIQIGSQRSAAEGAVDLVAGKAKDTRNKKKSK